MLAVLSLVFFLLLFSGMPVVFAMCIAAAAALLAGDITLTVVPQRMINQVDSFPLLAVPFFIFAGEVMEKGGISARLVHFATALIGHLRGGLAQVCVLSSMIFAGITGASAADASAIGSILIPAMIKKGYSRPFVASLQAAAGAIGPIIPPSVLMIVYASIANVSVGAMFLGGFVPGVLIGIGLMVISYIWCKKLDYPKEERASWKYLFKSLFDSLVALIVPIIIVGGIVSGIFTATEAGAVAAVYSLVVAMFVFREIKASHLPKIFVNSAITTSLVMIIVSAAGVFGWILASQNLPTMTLNFLASLSSNRYVMLFFILGFILAIGCVMEILSAAIIMIPVLFPIGIQLGFNEVHFAVLMVIAMVIGSVTPPVGVTLYLTIGMANTTLKATNKYIWTFVSAMVAVVVLAAFFDDLIMFLPRMFLGTR
jgi:C4-dicarboxylate transporter DctM subunit